MALRSDFLIARIPTLHDCAEMSLFAAESADRAQVYHASFEGMYRPTPLICLQKLAEALGLGGIYLKDESKRFGLNAFKALGGSYAIGRYIADRLSIPEEEMTLARLTAPHVRERLTEITGVASHGRLVSFSKNASCTCPKAARRSASKTSARRAQR